MKNVHRTFFVAAVLLVFSMVVLMGCRKSGDGPSAVSDASLPASLFLAAAPEGVTPIAALKASAREGDAVTVKAVVGGRKNAFVANRAVMTVIDASLENPCVATDDHCPTPWDYCCTPADELLPQMASIQILGSDDRPLAIDLNKLDPFKPLNTLVIQGTVGPRADNATLVIHATGFFVASQQG
jgi:hypothetical protein